MKRTGVWGCVLLLVATLGLTACATGSGAPATPSLYRRLGGREGIAGVVDAFMKNADADPKIGPAFKALPLPRRFALQSNIADFVCENTGGPCSYTGRTIKEAHKGLGLTKADADACNAALGKALDDAKVAPGDKAEVMKLVQSLMPDIVEK